MKYVEYFKCKPITSISGPSYQQLVQEVKSTDDVFVIGATRQWFKSNFIDLRFLLGSEIILQYPDYADTQEKFNYCLGKTKHEDDDYKAFIWLLVGSTFKRVRSIVNTAAIRAGKQDIKVSQNQVTASNLRVYLECGIAATCHSFALCGCWLLCSKI